MAVSVDAGSDDADNEATRAPTATADVQDAAAADGDGPSEADPAANDAAAEAPPPAVDLSSVCSYE